MSRNTSILAFYLKNGIYRVIGISLLMASAEVFLFIAGNSDAVTTFGDCIDASHIAFVFPAALLLHFLLNSSILGKSSMKRTESCISEPSKATWTRQTSGMTA